jgi:hypothetical protein
MEKAAELLTELFGGKLYAWKTRTEGKAKYEGN